MTPTPVQKFPPHIIPHLIAVKKHPRARRRKILMWAARCNRINADRFKPDRRGTPGNPPCEATAAAYDTIAGQQEDTAQWALAMAFGRKKQQRQPRDW
jgi:hypothetical protein